MTSERSFSRARCWHLWSWQTNAPSDTHKRLQRSGRALCVIQAGWWNPGGRKTKQGLPTILSLSEMRSGSVGNSNASTVGTSSVS